MAKDPRGPWARLYAGIIHDPKWLAGDRDARLVFMTGIALAKGAGNTGDLSLRAMVGVQWGAMEPGEVESAAEQLVESGLWVPSHDADQFRLKRYDRWQDTEAELDEQRNRKRIGALKTNHGKGQHRTAVDDCPLCHPQPPPAKPPKRDANDETGRTPGQSGSAIAPAKRALRPDQTRPDSDQTPPTPPAPSVDNEQPEIGLVIEVADELIGIVATGIGEADQRVVWFTGRAMENGWGQTELLDVAWDVFGRNLDDPIQYLIGCLRKRAAGERGPNPPPDRLDLRPMTEAELLADYYERFPEEAPTT